MNLWVLFLCRFLAQSSVNNKKVILTALLTALGETFILCVPVASAVMKIILGFGGITIIAVYGLFRPQSREYFYRLLIYSYLAIFVLGGILILLESVFEKKKISMTTWGILVVLFVFLIEEIYIKINRKSEFCQVILTLAEGIQCQVTALIDSGNGLVEPISKSPVSIVEEGVIGVYKNYLRAEKFRMIPYHSVGKDRGMLEAYFIDCMEIKGEG